LTILGFQQAIEGGVQDEVDIAGSLPLFRAFLGWDYVMGMGMSAHGFTLV
jgi:hypothetical protein